jgi:hypothetical protein
MLYAQEVSTMLNAGLNFHNGSAMTARIFSTYYEGITGKLSFRNNNERDRDFDLKTFDARTGQFQVIFSMTLFFTVF